MATPARSYPCMRCATLHLAHHGRSFCPACRTRSHTERRALYNALRRARRADARARTERAARYASAYALLVGTPAPYHGTRLESAPCGPENAPGSTITPEPKEGPSPLDRCACGALKGLKAQRCEACHRAHRRASLAAFPAHSPAHRAIQILQQWYTPKEIQQAMYAYPGDGWSTPRLQRIAAAHYQLMRKLSPSPVPTHAGRPGRPTSTPLTAANA